MTDHHVSVNRAVSEVLGFTLVFALVLSTVILVSLTGFGGLDDVRQFEQTNNAERAFDVVAENIEDVLVRGAPSRSTEIKLTNAQLYTGDQVTINITATDSSGTNNPLVANATYEFQPIIYEGEGGTKLVYSGGAVFREGSRSGSMVRDPPYILEEERVGLTVPVTRSRSVQSASGSKIRLRTIAADEARVLDVYKTETPYDEIQINVTSPRYELWARYLNEQPAVVGSCSTDDAKNSVTCDLATDSTNAPRVLTAAFVRINIEFER